MSIKLFLTKIQIKKEQMKITPLKKKKKNSGINKLP